MKCNDTFFKKSAIIDLHKGTVTIHSNRDYFPAYLGGKGLAQRILFDSLEKGTDPLHPHNVLILSAGPLTGTDVPSSCRHSFDTLNPLTHGVGSSNSCGYLGPELKFSGFNQIILREKSPHSVFIFIDDGYISIQKAEHLTGLHTGLTEEYIRKDLGDEKIQVASIGPAGESQVLYASIMTNKTRAAAKCGVGAVMGSKNVKAIAVRGCDTIPIAHVDRFAETVAEALEKIAHSPSLQTLKKSGFAGFLTAKNELSSLAFKNFQQSHVDIHRESYESLIPQKYQQYIHHQMGGFNCPIQCDKQYVFDDSVCEALEANSLTNFACKLGIQSPEAVMQLHMQCDELGMDEDSLAGTIAWATECYERGILLTSDIGFPLQWNDPQTVSSLMTMIAHREGFGNILAQGSYRASQMLGKGQRYAMHIKGQDLYEHLRTMKGWALGVVIATRGGGHTSGAPMTEFMDLSPEESEKKWGIPAAGDPRSYEGKADLVVYYERLHAVVNSLGVCLFISDWEDPQLLGLEDFATLLTHASGHECEVHDLKTIGERIISVEKAFNTLHAGFTREDDYPPDRFFNEPVTSGPLQGEVLHRAAWDTMLDRYYALHGWDIASGLPKEEALIQVGLSDIYETLVTDTETHQLLSFTGQ
jgi:aldehyde:ferredoxin oxidoreductase